ncbi:tRNA (adenosine(37)-N6)-threonylcarbamoyltransferase complex dimerization subunit type 1 TsaB [Variovorax terrae]|uniref:tRNA (Adenosine(37)-N6)-threonylcarbamoyltransferase complex dimerization subunit type 1 TsaB n=1 Tax=Variovorax terrae TaxID=2923278 RepID=A0A9X2AT02_9BURK|nr:tRNA (adenosine(37)-N6)-threonylcarbamoyltransferase complex dimerization subunit type 1 TsaB [Variovorax terrae]MCJ0765876.1 tRNA (adenosine(37)-N6)-threonylcarbamoyltransferase complex dimerization subunit type 1 TsaB [Variovorax terrae]
MKILAFDTSTETLSIALGDGARVWLHAGAGGAQASATLIPAIEALMAQAGLGFAQLDAIAFGRGPGSFTGLRTACAVAQGLAFGAAVPVLPIDTLLAVAEEARHHHGATRVMAVLDARMDEVYAASYEFDGRQWRQQAQAGLAKPEALSLAPGWALAGNAFAAYGARLPAAAARLDALPTGAALLRLAPALLAAGAAVPADQALPLYIRDKVAKTTEERAADKAAAP